MASLPRISRIDHLRTGLAREIGGHFHKAQKILSAPGDYLQRRRVASHAARSHPAELERDGACMVTELVHPYFAALSTEAHAIERAQQEQAVVRPPDPNGSRYSSLFAGIDLPVESAFYALALDEALLDMAASYLGTTPLLHGIRLLRSRPISQEEQLGRGWDRDQMWHRDKYDRKNVRLIVYLSDCGPESGPFMFLPRPVSDRLFFTYYRRPNDAEIARRGLTDQVVRMEGPAGSAFLVDVRSVVHCGGRCLSRPRLIFSAIYTSAAPWLPPDHMKSETRTALLSRFGSPLQKMALQAP